MNDGAAEIADQDRAACMCVQTDLALLSPTMNRWSQTGRMGLMETKII